VATRLQESHVEGQQPAGSTPLRARTQELRGLAVSTPASAARRMAEHLLSTAAHRTMPGNYVRPEAQRPRLAEVVSGAPIPVVDLACPDRAAAVAAIGAACRSHGFFQVP